MEYEIRKWSDELDCLYTDDRRLRDMAARSGEMTIVSSYFRTARASQPFAWDILGPPRSLGPLARQFARGPARGRPKST